MRRNASLILVLTIVLGCSAEDEPSIQLDSPQVENQGLAVDNPSIAVLNLGSDTPNILVATKDIVFFDRGFFLRIAGDRSLDGTVNAGPVMIAPQDEFFADPEFRSVGSDLESLLIKWKESSLDEASLEQSEFNVLKLTSNSSPMSEMTRGVFSRHWGAVERDFVAFATSPVDQHTILILCDEDPKSNWEECTITRSHGAVYFGKRIKRSELPQWAEVDEHLLNVARSLKTTSQDPKSYLLTLGNASLLFPALATKKIGLGQNGNWPQTARGVELYIEIDPESLAFSFLDVSVAENRIRRPHYFSLELLDDTSWGGRALLNEFGEAECEDFSVGTCLIAGQLTDTIAASAIIPEQYSEHAQVIWASIAELVNTAQVQ